MAQFGVGEYVSFINPVQIEQNQQANLVGAEIVDFDGGWVILQVQDEALLRNSYYIVRHLESAQRARLPQNIFQRYDPNTDAATFQKQVIRLLARGYRLAQRQLADNALDIEATQNWIAAVHSAIADRIEEEG